jgi:predicted O-linked N-acetylglucosamine transferase (SPINDLY family)
LKPLPQPDFLHLLASADVILDPFPFCGGNTSYESFAVGAPVVTYPGKFLRGRLTSAMYKRMGLDSLVAQSVEEYVDKVVALGVDREHNRTVRDSIVGCAGILFENQEEISSWEFLFRKWVEELP